MALHCARCTVDKGKGSDDVAGKRRLPITRRIVRILAKDERTLIPGPYPVSDDELRATFADLLATEVNAWLLHKAGALPEDWQLVYELRAEGFAARSTRDLVEWPEIDAAMKWRGLSIAQRSYVALEWRKILHGPDRGKVCQVEVTHHTGDLVQSDEVPPIDVAVVQLPHVSPYPV